MRLFATATSISPFQPQKNSLTHLRVEVTIHDDCDLRNRFNKTHQSQGARAFLRRGLRPKTTRPQFRRSL